MAELVKVWCGGACKKGGRNSNPLKTLDRIAFLLYLCLRISNGQASAIEFFPFLHAQGVVKTHLFRYKSFFYLVDQYFL